MLKRPERNLSGADDVRLLTLGEVCRLLCVGRTLVGKLVRSKVLGSLRIGRARRVPLGALRRFVAQYAVAAAHDEHRYHRIVGPPSGSG